MRDDRTVTLPPWLTTVGKSGAWAILAFWLIYSLLLQRENELSAVSANVAQNGTAIGNISHKMDEAASAMHSYVMKSQTEADRIKILLLQVCVQQAEMLKIAGGTQKCFDAAQGKANGR